MEHWYHGKGGRAAVIEALDQAGTIISAAGIIMFLAFGALGASTTPVLNQIGFMLCVGVLLDCFITTKVRPRASIQHFGERFKIPDGISRPTSSLIIVAPRHTLFSDNHPLFNGPRARGSQLLAVDEAACLSDGSRAASQHARLRPFAGPIHFSPTIAILEMEVRRSPRIQRYCTVLRRKHHARSAREPSFPQIDPPSRTPELRASPPVPTPGA